MIKGFYIDQWTEGIRTPEQAAQTLAFAKNNGVTDLIVMTGRFERFLNDPRWKPRVSLDDIIANRGTMRVHAWVNMGTLWRKKWRVEGQFPQDWIISDEPFWESVKMSTERTKEFLDPAVPEVRDYIVNRLKELVQNHNIQGLHLERMRYPAMSTSKFSDAEKIAALNILMERISTELRAIKPNLIISLAVKSDDNSELYDKSFFRNWLSAGWLDYICPMIFSNHERYVPKFENNPKVIFVLYTSLGLPKIKEFAKTHHVLIYKYQGIKNGTGNF